LEIIRRALKLSEFDKEVSFDRLFPNQDSLAKEGFGNLIAIPMQGQATRLSNTLFLNPETFQPYSDQWAFLQTIHKHTIAELESAYANVLNKTVSFTPEVPGTSSISLILNSKIVLNRSELTPLLIHFLKEKLNFISTEYLTKKRLGKSVYKVQKFFKLLEENGDDVLLPRGFLSQLISFLRNNGIAYQLKEQRPQILEVKFTSNIKLLPAQQPIVGKALEVDSGVIVAPSGSGKTIIGLEIIAQRKLPALILVHRKQLLDQWIERTQSFLEIPKKDIGQYYSVKKKTGEQITVAMMQTLVRIGNFAELQNKFGTIIVDECHHTPAKTFREVIGQLNPKYIYGLTATPKRKHNDEPLIYMFIGNIIAQMEHAPEIIAETPELSYKSVKTQIIIRETNLEVPFKFTTDNFQLLAKLICFDTNRNQMIVKDIQEQTSQGKKVLFLSERRDHLEILSLYLKGLCETITISGEDSNAKRAIKLKQVQTGHYQAILSTGQFFGEGLDIPGIDCLIIAFPFSFEGKLIQYIGRLRGKDNQKIIIDYEDKKIAFLERQFKRRKRYYNKISKS
ncbi:MAG TPA: type III restriction endonuclease subunit R, partial [Candidatus Jacksonbacteria bacterium]|nr:type III restriction endonuclease subunit R [Candidatus Jacksonbacteria bacterium]